MTHGIHKGLNQAQLDQLAADRRYLLRKSTVQANERMRERTAREQLLAAQRELERGPDDVVDDHTDDRSWSNKFQ